MPDEPPVDSPAPSETVEDARRRVWDGLPEEIKQDPSVKRKFLGVGDVVAAVAKPIARIVGVDPECKPCKDRQARLNARFPFRRRGSR